MNTRTKLATAALALVALGGAAAADSHHGHGDGAGAAAPGAGGPDMMQMMNRMHGQMMGGGMGMMQGGMPGMGSMGDGLMAMMEPLDADGDGTVTPDEAREGLKALVAEYDADGDETLSIAEFETLHSALIRESMVDRFQFLDDDGDGQVTMGEIVKPADMMERMQSMRERMMQGSSMSSGSGMERKDAPGRSMMDNN